MAFVDIKAGRGRKKFVEFIVVGDSDNGCVPGDIRWEWWSRAKTSPMLRVQYRDPKERTTVDEVAIMPEYGKRGWALLRDLYAAEPEKAHHWEDFLAFAQEQMDNPMGMVEIAKDGTKTAVEFPEEYLPTKVLELRKQAKVQHERSKFVFPSEAKKASAGDDEPTPKKRGRPKKSGAIASGGDIESEVGGSLVRGN